MDKLVCICKTKNWWEQEEFSYQRSFWFVQISFVVRYCCFPFAGLSYWKVSGQPPAGVGRRAWGHSCAVLWREGPHSWGLWWLRSWGLACWGQRQLQAQTRRTPYKSITGMLEKHQAESWLCCLKWKEVTLKRSTQLQHLCVAAAYPAPALVWWCWPRCGPKTHSVAVSSEPNELLISKHKHLS